jgi:acetylornithine deacetylase/succinyl-diaminopimelate desuccinylase-like protein
MPLLLVVLFATWLSPIAAVAVAAQEPSGPYEQMSVDLLRNYLQIDTTNPPGNELKGALFLKGVLEREGIPVEIDEFAPGRANLLATLAGSGKRRPLLLASHIDVVPADASRWSAPPFSGAVKDGSIYGRGAVDMKSEGILQLVTLIRLKRERVPLDLDRDVLLLATADEEVDFAGALRAVKPEAWGKRLERCEYGIAEGGENRLGADGVPVYFGVQTAQKAAFWLGLKTTGTPGHGSRPLADSALNRLIRALDRIRQHQTEMKALPSVEKFFRDQAPRVSPPYSEWYRDIRKAIEDPIARKAIYDGDESMSALLRNTISITVVRAGSKTNVIPGTAEAELDVRLLPGASPDAFLAELRRAIDDPTVEVAPLQGTFYAPSEVSTDTELFRVIERTLARRFPGVPVTTRMGTGATENAIYRPLGIVSYGFTPLLLTKEEDASQHADDERLSEATLRRSVGILYEVVAEIARR